MLFKRPLLIIFISGLFAFIISLGGGYYWATSPAEEAEEEQVAETEDSADEISKTEEDEQPQFDEPTIDDWASFIDYEGERVDMLGIRREYDQVNFRRGPATEHEIVGTPSGGSLLAPLDLFEGWFRARDIDGNVGWIHRSLVRQIRAPKTIADKFREELPPLEESVQSKMPDQFLDQTHVVVKANRVNLRQGAGPQFRIIGRAYSHQIFRLLARKQDWAYVQTHLGDVGWINTEYVEINRPSRPELSSIEVAEANIWPNRGQQFRPLIRVDSPQELTVLEQDSNWLLVETDDGNIGWFLQQDQ